MGNVAGCNSIPNMIVFSLHFIVKTHLKLQSSSSVAFTPHKHKSRTYINILIASSCKEAQPLPGRPWKWQKQLGSSPPLVLPRFPPCRCLAIELSVVGGAPNFGGLEPATVRLAGIRRNTSPRFPLANSSKNGQRITPPTNHLHSMAVAHPCIHVHLLAGCHSKVASERPIPSYSR